MSGRINWSTILNLFKNHKIYYSVSIAVLIIIVLVIFLFFNNSNVQTVDISNKNYSIVNKNAQQNKQQKTNNLTILPIKLTDLPIKQTRSQEASIHSIKQLANIDNKKINSTNKVSESLNNSSYKEPNLDFSNNSESINIPATQHIEDDTEETHSIDLTNADKNSNVVKQVRNTETAKVKQTQNNNEFPSVKDFIIGKGKKYFNEKIVNSEKVKEVKKSNLFQNISSAVGLLLEITSGK